MRWTEEMLAAHLQKRQVANPPLRGEGTPKPGKYGNKKVTVDGIVFDSAKEARRYSELVSLQKLGQISGLDRQRTFILAPAVILDGRKKPALRYVADFCYTAKGALVVEDVKSQITRENRAFRIKQHLMKSVHGIDLLLT